MQTSFTGLHIGNRTVYKALQKPCTNAKQYTNYAQNALREWEHFQQQFDNTIFILTVPI